MADLSKAALPALWKADPAFVELAKFLYGENVTVEDIQKDVWGSNPTKRKRQVATGIGALGATGAAAATVHGTHQAINAFRGGGGWKKHATVAGIEGASLAGDVFLTHTMHEAVDDEGKPKKRKYEVKAASAPDQADVHVPRAKGKQKPPLPTDEESRKIVGKAFIDIVSKAYTEGLLDDEGNLNWFEINKSRQYVRDHAGRFSGAGKHTARNVGELALAGGLAAGGAALAAKSPHTVKYAAESARYVGHHLSSKDPVERHVARALLPHALKSGAKAVGAAGGGTVASAGAVYEGTQAYTHMRQDAAHAATRRRNRLEEKSASAAGLRLGAEVMTHGMDAAEHIEGHMPKHAKMLGRIKRIRHAAAEGARKAILNPPATGMAIVDMVKSEDGDVSKDWTKWNAEHKGRSVKERRNRAKNQSLAGVTTAVGSLGLAGAGAADERLSLKEKGHVEAQQGDALLRHGFNEPFSEEENVVHRNGQTYRVSQDASWGDRATRLGATANKLGKEAKQSRRLKHGGIAGMAVGAGLMGAAVHEELAASRQHRAEKEARRQKRQVKAARDTTWEGEFSKVDEDKQQVFGWASVTEMDGKPVVDLQGDYIHPDEIEKAAYEYVVNARVGGDMHSRVDEDGNVIKSAPLHVSDLIESMVFTPEKCEAMGVSKSLAGRWWTGFKINDPDIWEKVKTGERTGFSIHGLGIRKSVEPEEIGLEDELIEKAMEVSASREELAENLCTLYEVTGVEKFLEEAEEVAEEIEKYVAEERYSTHEELSADAAKHPIRRRISPGHWKQGVTFADDDGNRIVSAGHAKPGVGTGARKVKRFSTDVGGEAGFGKHLDHGIHAPQVNAQQSRNAGVYGSMGSAAGGLAGGLIGAKSGHLGEGAGIGGVIGGMAGTGAGMAAGKKPNRPQRPPSVHQAMLSTKAARAPEAEDYFGKGVDNTNRLGGSSSSRQGLYTQFALQQATEQLAPQVAQHLQAMQEQRWQQQMMEQQMMAQQAQQQGQDFAVQMGPYANQPSQRQQSNPLAPPQQPQGGTQSAPQAPQPAPTAQNLMGS